MKTEPRSQAPAHVNHHSRSESRPRRRWSRALLAALAALLVATTAAAQSLEREVFVSVLSKADEPVMTLAPADFIIREDGRLREVLRARRATDPIDIALLVDTSQALGRQVADVRSALESFIAKMAGQADIAIISLGDRPTIFTDYTRDAARLKDGVGKVFPITGAGAYVLEGIKEALTGLGKRKPERSAIVIVWAGGIEFSNASYEPLLTKLEESRAALHVMTVGTSMPADAMATEGRNREIVFDRGTTLSGGRRQNVLSSMGLTGAMDKLAAELLGQYRVTYARPESLIPPQKIDVGVRPVGLTVGATPILVKSPAKSPAK